MHIELSFFVVSSVRNNILIKKFIIYRGLLYYIYSKPLTNPLVCHYFCYLSSSVYFYSLSSIPFYSLLLDVSLCYICSISYLLFFFWLLTILCHVSIYITIETIRFLIFVIVVLGFPNIHGCLSISIDNS